MELQFVFTFACVVVVPLYDFARQLAADFLTVAVEVVVEVVLQHLFQFVELRFHRVGHITLRFGRLAKERNASLAQLVVLELVGVDEFLEIVENLVGDFKFASRGDGGVLGCVFCGVVECPLVAHDVVNQSVHFWEGDFYIGSDATTVAHLTAVSRVKHVAQTIGLVLERAVGVAVAVVDFLNQAATWNVVFGDGEFEQTVERQWAGGLHQSLAVGTTADNHGAVEVLECASGDFACRGRPAVDEHRQWHIGHDGLLRGFIHTVILCGAAFCGQHLSAFRQEEAENFDGFVHQSAAVAAQVEHHRLHGRVGLEFEQRLLHTLGRVLVVGVERDVAYVVFRHAVVGDGVEFDFLAGEGERLDAVGGVGALDGHLDLGVGLTFQAFAHLGAFQRSHAVAVNHNDLVAALQSGTSRRAVGVRTRNKHAAGLAFHDVGTDAAVFAGANHQKVVLVVVVDIFGVGVDFVKHRVDGGFDMLFSVERVNIKSVQLLI